MKPRDLAPLHALVALATLGVVPACSTSEGGGDADAGDELDSAAIDSAATPSDASPMDGTSDAPAIDSRGDGAVGPKCDLGPSKPTTGFFVTPTGASGGDGSEGKPWDLATALGGPAAVKPGDTIWLHGGTYVGSFTVNLAGDAGKPITVRSYPGEWAVIDGKDPGGAVSLEVSGHDVVLRDFELMSSNTTRTFTETGSFTGRSGGLDFNAPNSKLVNVVIHDTSGVGFWTPAPGSEVYGLISYDNGWDAPDRSHGHGLYIQNKDAPKLISDSIVFDNFSYGFHAYTEGGFLVGIHFVGNVVFQTGAASATSGLNTDFLVGGLQPADDIIVRENMGYRTPGQTNIQFGYGSADKSLTLTDNYFAGGVEVKAWASLTATKNTIIGVARGLDAAKYPDNSITATAPTATKVFVRPNAYETGRANVVVYNWGMTDTVSVDLSSVLAVGATYEVRNAQNVLGPAIKTGNFDGAPVALPMTGLEPAQPIGLPGAITDAEKTGKAFNVFVVRTTACP